MPEVSYVTKEDFRTFENRVEKKIDETIEKIGILGGEVSSLGSILHERKGFWIGHEKRIVNLEDKQGALAEKVSGLSGSFKTYLAVGGVSAVIGAAITFFTRCFPTGSPGGPLSP